MERGADAAALGALRQRQCAQAPAGGLQCRRARQLRLVLARRGRGLRRAARLCRADRKPASGRRWRRRAASAPTARWRSIPPTRRNLELVRGLDGRRDGSLLATIDRTLTGPGARLLAERIAAPLTERAEIERRLDLVQLFVERPRRARAGARGAAPHARRRARPAAPVGRPRRPARSSGADGRPRVRRGTGGHAARRARGAGAAARAAGRDRHGLLRPSPADRRAGRRAGRRAAARSRATAASSARATAPSSTSSAPCATTAARRWRRSKPSTGPRPACRRSRSGTTT